MSHIMRGYLACPVRGCSPEMKDKLDKYVADYEATGKKMHYPHRDVDQAIGGNAICEAHRRAMLQSDEFHLWWTGERMPNAQDETGSISRISTGTFFDFGGIYMMKHTRLGYTCYLANWDEALPQIHRDSYLSLLIQLEADNSPDDHSRVLGRLCKYCLGYELQTRIHIADIFEALDFVARTHSVAWVHRIP